MTTDTDAAAALVPLLLGQGGVPSLTTRPDPTAASYWSDPITRSGGVERLVFGADGAAMLERLVAYWRAGGEEKLPLPEDALEALRRALHDGAAEATSGGQPLAASPLF